MEKTFKTAYEAANWVNENFPTETQEKTFQNIITYKKVNGVYKYK